MTQTEIAKILSISQRTYSRYENDERSIPIEILSELADYHHTSVDYLIGRTDVKKPYEKPCSKS
jgi:transcriptional regulator with XRE-family HTH domain